MHVRTLTRLLEARHLVEAPLGILSDHRLMKHVFKILLYATSTAGNFATHFCLNFGAAKGPLVAQGARGREIWLANHQLIPSIGSRPGWSSMLVVCQTQQPTRCGEGVGETRHDGLSTPKYGNMNEQKDSEWHGVCANKRRGQTNTETQSLAQCWLCR